jgi:hypothetical protein
MDTSERPDLLNLSINIEKKERGASLAPPVLIVSHLCLTFYVTVHKSDESGMFAVPSFGMKSLAREFKLIFQIGNHDHLDCMVFSQVIADADANFAPLATVHSDECGLGCIVVKNGVGFRAELRTKATGSLTANGLIDMCD